VKSKNETVPLPYGASGIDAAAMVTERQTRALFVAELMSLAAPSEGAPEARASENLGTPYTVDDFDNDPTKT
jgi:hypothetical protein